MNAISIFRQCTLTDEQLLTLIDSLTDTIFKTQTVPTRHIPALPNSDYDLLIGELLLRYQELKQNISFKQAIEKFCTELNNDAELRLAFQANIAMAFYDEYKLHIRKNIKKKGTKAYVVIDTKLHEIANSAANNFLNLLIEKKHENPTLNPKKTAV